MIIVTGATGALGRLIVKELVARVGAAQVGASVRDPDKAAELTALGVSVRRGDFADPTTLPAAFAGATQVLMVSSNARAFGGDTLAQHRAAIVAAKGVGAQRIVYTSHMAASATSQFPPMHDHAATEVMLRGSGLAWTSLRNGFYADSGLALLGDALTSGVVAAPADGPVSWTAHADLAAAAAVILTTAVGRFDGPTPALTGSQALDLAGIAAIASDLGRPVRREVISDDDQRAKLAARGAERAAPIVLGLYHAAHAGEFAAIDPTLADLLGRPPLSIRDLLAAKLTN